MSEVLEPRQIAFLKNYLDPKSDTFSNALQSGIKAGFSEEYSSNITSLMPDWLSENIGRTQMLKKAEKNLEEMLDMPIQTLEWQGRGEDAEQVVITDVGLVRIKQDTSKFVVSRLNKEKWSERSELTGKDGGEIKINIVNYGDSTTDKLSTEDISTTDTASD